MEKNEYHLIIDINDNVNGEMSSSPITQNSASSNSNSDSDDGLKMAKRLKRLAKYEIAKPFLSSTKQMILNDVDTYYGSGELSQRINFGMSMVDTTVSTIKNGIGLSAVLGLSVPGGIGLSAVLTGLQKMLEINVRQNEINNKQKLENEQLQILRGRAGVQFNRSRVGE